MPTNDHIGQQNYSNSWALFSHLRYLSYLFTTQHHDLIYPTVWLAVGAPLKILQLAPRASSQCKNLLLTTVSYTRNTEPASKKITCKQIHLFPLSTVPSRIEMFKNILFLRTSLLAY